MVYYSILLPSLPLAGDFWPTVVKSCLDLSGGGIYCSGFLFTCWGGGKREGGNAQDLLGVMVDKIFNRSPITLKFEAGKI